jgi:hypothetical protein
MVVPCNGRRVESTQNVVTQFADIHDVVVERQILNTLTALHAPAKGIGFHAGRRERRLRLAI